MPARQASLFAIAIAALFGTAVVWGAPQRVVEAQRLLQAPSLKAPSQQSDKDPSADNDSGAQSSDPTAAHPAKDNGASSSTPSISQADDSSSAADDSGDAAKAPPVRDVALRTGRLGQQSKIDILRYIDGEFAKALVSLPSGKQALTIQPGEPAQSLQAVGIRRVDSIAVNKGDPIQITNVDFRDKQILVQINGGGKKKFHLKDHLQIGMSNDPSTLGDPNSHRGEGSGSLIIVDYGRPVPEMTPLELKHDLAGVLEFQTEHSAAVNWVETLPKEFKDGIQDHHAVVGMNEDMVIAALGRPEHKVREKDDQGDDTEDWIYGNPPAKTIFVTFEDGKVVRVKEFS